MSKRTHRAGARPSRAQQAPLYPGDPDADATGHRQERLERILHDEIQTLIRDEAADPALEGVRLVSVHLSVDGGHARIGYVVEAPLSAERQVETASLAGLGRAAGFLRARLASLLDLKRLPKLSFTFVGVQDPGASSSGGAPWHE
ncbi:ribosome-binding factor A [Anaeromyxobacter terrae]|uniref:ribosome-binding factor A n=1 Tax=Anaeromyxobacter terrae TaxID=2925406 RepID=UPI001F584951|nr:ribosome-binding factor A [Anaeromyxobacter sp. SG22]